MNVVQETEQCLEGLIEGKQPGQDSTILRKDRKMHTTFLFLKSFVFIFNQVYMSVYTCVYVCACVYMYMCMYVCVCLHVCLHVCMVCM